MTTNNSHSLGMERLARSKHSSLLQKFKNYVRKKFYNIRPWRTKYKISYKRSSLLRLKRYLNPNRVTENRYFNPKISNPHCHHWYCRSPWFKGSLDLHDWGHREAHLSLFNFTQGTMCSCLEYPGAFLGASCIIKIVYKQACS